MFEKGGIAYVYLCYGIHHLFNIVTNREGIPHAILVRAIHPLEGTEVMLKRRSKQKIDKTLCSGPGTVSQSLGITTALSGHLLQRSPIWLEDIGIQIDESIIQCGPRIGIDYAGEDAKLPWRFYCKNSFDPLDFSLTL